MRILNSNLGRMAAVAIIAAATGLGTGIALAGQPDMEGALHALEDAQSHLNRVTQNKGGHADAARQLVAYLLSRKKGYHLPEENGPVPPAPKSS